MAMRNWDGMRDDTTVVDDDMGVTNLVGASFYVTGQLGRRSGLTAISANGGTALGSFRSAVTGAWLLVVTSTGTVESVSL